jgi:hypothetical protein
MGPRPHVSIVKAEQAPSREPDVLELRRDLQGLRHYLAGFPVRFGDDLELLLSEGRWLRGRYEWTGVSAVWPSLRVGLSGWVSATSQRKLTGAMPLPPTARLRWPL